MIRVRSSSECNTRDVEVMVLECQRFTAAPELAPLEPRRLWFGSPGGDVSFVIDLDEWGDLLERIDTVIEQANERLALRDAHRRGKAASSR